MAFLAAPHASLRNHRARRLEMTSRSTVSSGSPYEPVVGYSRAVRVGDRVFVSGTAPQFADGHTDPDPGAQMRRCLEIIEQALAEAGCGIGDVVRTRMYIVDPADIGAIGAVHAEIFGDTRPASTAVVVAGLLDAEWKVEVEADAVVGAAEG